MTKQHNWVPSTYGHGESMCTICGMTNREAAALRTLNECETASTLEQRIEAENERLRK